MEIKEQLNGLEQKITKGLKKAYQKMIELKKYKKSPIITSKDGKIIEIIPEDIQLSKKA